MLKTITICMMMLSLLLMFFVALIMGIVNDYKSYKEARKEQGNIVRRKQLIKEMKAGTFDEEKRDQMMKELRDLMKGMYYFNYRCVMTKNYAGIWELTTLSTDNYSWI